MNAQKKEQLIQELISQGRMDSRNLYVFNNAKKLPLGVYGLCIVSIANDTLFISETDMSSKVGDLMFAVPISEMKDVKKSSFPLNPYLKFNWEGESFHLGGVTKEMLSLIG